jgi:NADH dehydrogenase
VTGGSGVVGNATVAELLKRGYGVRLLTRHADTDAAVWPEGVEARVGDITEAGSIVGAAEGCYAVVHIAGAVRDQPEAPLHQVNVAGTRHLVADAARAGVRRLVFVSSLGADRGSSEYHRSKRSAEEVIGGFPGLWVILRSGMVYGPGDEVISVLIRMMRSLPLVPVVGRSHPFQPIWHEDLAAAIAASLEREDLGGRTLELAGSETTTIDDLLDRLEGLTDRAPARVPLPSFVAKVGASLSERFDVGAWLGGLTRFDTPIDRSKLTMLEEDNVLRASEGNALIDVFGIEPKPLDEGLRQLVQEALPEQLPDQGEGPLERKRFGALVQDSSLSAPELMRVFRAEARELLPIEFGSDEDGETERSLESGMTLTLALPLRGQVQVRVEEATDDHLTLATLEGHPLAGIVRFIARPDDGSIRFLIEIFSRSANVLDLVMMKAGGTLLQNSVWRQAVERVVARTGGNAPDGVREERAQLEGEEAEAVEVWVAAMVEARKREENAQATGRSAGSPTVGAEVAPPESAT